MQKLSLGLHITGENNRFALFEVCGNVSKVIDDRTILADILGKFERYSGSGLSISKVDITDHNNVYDMIAQCHRDNIVATSWHHCTVSS